MTHTLQNCPFCGSAAELEYDAGNENLSQRWWARCMSSDCGAKGKGFFGSNTWGGPGDLKKMDAKAQADAVAHWNRRAPSARLKGLRDILGHVENGTDSVVSIFQDDATREWVVKVSSKGYYGPTFADALDAAIEGEKG